MEPLSLHASGPAVRRLLFSFLRDIWIPRTSVDDAVQPNTHMLYRHSSNTYNMHDRIKLHAVILPRAIRLNTTEFAWPSVQRVTGLSVPSYR